MIDWLVEAQDHALWEIFERFVSGDPSGSLMQSYIDILEFVLRDKGIGPLG